MAIANIAGNSPRTIRRVHQAAASALPAFGNTPANFHSFRERRRSNAEMARAFIITSYPGRRPALGRPELVAVAANLAESARGPDPDLVEVRIDGVGAEPFQDHIRRGVVAEHDHQVDDIGQGKPYAIRDFTAEDAGARYFFGSGNRERLGPLRLSASHRIEDREHDRKVDRARRA